MRAVLGWLRGEAKHCSMAAIPSIAEEDARRPSRERETLVREQTRAVNRMKSTLIRFGIRTFKVKLRQASKHLEGLRGPEGEPLPANTMAELRRDLARLQLIRGQVREIERARLERLKRAPRQGTHPMMRMLARIMGIGIETADVLVHEVLSRKLRDQRAVARYGALTGSPDESGSKRRERARPSRQCAGAPRHDSTGMALAHVPEEQHLGKVVSSTNDRRQAGVAQSHDCRIGAQIADRPVALCHDRRGSGRRRPTSSDMNGL
jgi:transposase